VCSACDEACCSSSLSITWPSAIASAECQKNRFALASTELAHVDQVVQHNRRLSSGRGSNWQCISSHGTDLNDVGGESHENRRLLLSIISPGPAECREAASTNDPETRHHNETLVYFGLAEQYEPWRRYRTARCRILGRSCRPSLHGCRPNCSLCRHRFRPLFWTTSKLMCLAFVARLTFAKRCASALRCSQIMQRAVDRTTFALRPPVACFRPSVQFEAGQAFAAALSDGIAQATTSIDSLEAPLETAHAQHGKLRRTLGHQSNILEVLEAPALMETCLRAGLYDEALDIAEYATSLYFAHKLWLPSAAAGGTQPNAAGSKVVRTVVAEIRRSCDELHETLVRALSTKIGLPQALQLLGHLRRLYTQQALARRRVAAAAHAHAQHELALTAVEAADGAGLGDAAADRRAAPASARVAPVFDFSLPEEEEAAIVDRLIAVFLSCRDAWHRGELDFISRHNAYNYVSGPHRSRAAAGPPAFLPRRQYALGSHCIGYCARASPFHCWDASWLWHLTCT